MTEQVICPECGDPKETHGSKYFRCCNSQFPIEGNKVEDQKEEDKTEEVEEVVEETESSGDKEATEVDNLRTEVKDERKQKGDKKSKEKEKEKEGSSGDWSLSDPSKKSHVNYIRSNTSLRSKSKIQKTLLNMREDKVEINTSLGEHR